MAMRTRTTNHGAFTLPELLAVIAILAVVAILAVPAMSSVRKRSTDLRCVTNLRATGMALMQYLGDHNGVFLPTKYWYSRLSTADSPGIRDYLGSTSTAKSTSTVYHYDSVLTCPTLKQLAPQKFPAMLNRCYSMNPFLIGKEISKPDDPTAGPNPGSPQRLVNVPAPAQMWAFTDGSGSLSDASEFGTVCSVAHVTNDNISYPHEKKQHFVFLDGHMESLARDELRSKLGDRLFWGDLRMAP